MAEKLKSFWEEVTKLLSDLFTSFLIFLLFIFSVGELYAIYFSRTGNDLLLWAPVFLLMILLAYKAFD